VFFLHEHCVSFRRYLVSVTTATNAQAESARDLETWLTRTQVSDLLKVSLGTIITWEREGKLEPQKRARSGNGRHEEIVYDPRQVVKLASVRMSKSRLSYVQPGEIAAHAFAAFDRGEGARDVVMELRRTPAQAKLLYQEWLELGGSARIVTDKHRARLVPLVGEFETVSELVELVEQRCKSETGL
jgi:hypothetical protein